MNWLLELFPAALGLGTAVVRLRREKLLLERAKLEKAKRCRAERKKAARK